MGVLLQSFFFGPGKVHGVPSPLDGDQSFPFWWDHLAAQANDLRKAGFSAIWLPPPLKGASGSFSSGYDAFDDYDLGSKDQKGSVPTRYGTREKLTRCIAMMRANGLDVYADLVENHRDGDDGHFHFSYVDAFGHPTGGRFQKGPGDFHPHVPPDPGVFDDRFQFGRDLAPMRVPAVFKSLLDAGDWLARALDVQGFRLDDAKGISTQFLAPLLNHGALAGKFAVGEFFDGDVGLVQRWMDAMQHRSAAFDFKLRFMLQAMCNSPSGFDMSSLDHAGLTGADPLGSVTFVENHDTDQHSPIVQNKMLAYAYILTAEGYPCVFYRDYSHDKNCFGLQPSIDRLMWIHEHLADGPTLQRFKDFGLFAFERTGGGRLLVALNKDTGTSRTITVQTGLPPHTRLEDFTGHEQPVTTDGHSNVTLKVPKNVNGLGYVCYARPGQITPFTVHRIATTQDFEGAGDLDIRPALEQQSVTVGRVFAGPGNPLEARLFFDNQHWASDTAIRLDLLNPDGAPAAHHQYLRDTKQGEALTFNPVQTGFYALHVQAVNTPPANKTPSYKLRVNYQAPQRG